MKSTSTILVVMAAFGPPAAAREAMLGNESTDHRRLGGSKRFWNVGPEYYTDLYARCCAPEEGPEWDDCNCPKRLSPDTPPSWAQAWLGSDSYAKKWAYQCGKGGWLCKKAFDGDDSECPDPPTD